MSEFLSEYFETTRIVPLAVPDLTPVGEAVMDHFRRQEYAVSGSRLAGGGWHISVQKGDWFRMLLGLKTALNIRIEPFGANTRVSAGIGIFDLQVVPTVITLFVFTPVILGQIWGIVQQQKLDEEAVGFIENQLAYYGNPTAPPVTSDFAAPRPADPPAPDPARTNAERELGDFPTFGV